LDVCGSVEQEPHGVGAAAVGGGVQRSGAVLAARLEWKAKIEHQRDGVVVAVFGSADECGAIVLVELSEQAGIGGEQSASLSVVCAQACVQELIHRGGSHAGAVTGQQLGEVASGQRGRQPVRSASVVS